MSVASMKRVYGAQAAAGTGIYTRNRQMEYKYNIHHETAAEEKKVSQKTVYFMMFMVIILLFSAWFGMIFFKSIISGVQMQINDINSEIRQLEQDNSILEAEKINALDIETIKTSAESMGMALPTASQVEYVDTAETSANLKILD